MDKAECRARGIPWPLGECISGSGDFEPHPGEERFDFPCSRLWRDYYEEAAEVYEADEPQHANTEEQRRRAYLTMKRYDPPMPKVVKKHAPEVRSVEV
jgi:hypothetical protein